MRATPEQTNSWLPFLQKLAKVKRGKKALGKHDRYVIENFSHFEITGDTIHLYEEDVIKEIVEVWSTNEYYFAYYIMNGQIFITDNNYH
jgi:hypothetical protein